METKNDQDYILHTPLFYPTIFYKEMNQTKTLQSPLEECLSLRP